MHSTQIGSQTWSPGREYTHRLRTCLSLSRSETELVQIRVVHCTKYCLVLWATPPSIQPELLFSQTENKTTDKAEPKSFHRSSLKQAKSSSTSPHRQGSTQQDDIKLVVRNQKVPEEQACKCYCLQGPARKFFFASQQTTAASVLGIILKLVSS